MSRRFSQVAISLWHGPAFRDLSDEGKIALLFFWCGPHSTSAGIGIVKDGYAVADLRWTPEKWLAARQEVEAAGFILRDDETETVFVVGYLLANPPANARHRAAITSQIASIECAVLRAMAEADLGGKGKSETKQEANLVPTASPQLMAMIERKGWGAAA